MISSDIKHRIRETTKIREKYPERVPIIVKKTAGSNLNDIDKNNLGKHFTTDKENTTSDDFLEKIGVIDFQGNYEYEKFFIITVETNVNNIDWYKTFDNRINYYGEDEINFISDKNLKIINIEEIEL